MFILIFLLTIFSVQADVMNLNEFMPTRMEDASVTELKKIDLQASARYEDASEYVIFRPNVRYGLVKRVQVEFSSDALYGPEDSEKSAGRSQAGFQWNFNDQDDWVPSFAISPAIAFPTGKDTEGIDPSVRLNMTYTLVGTLSEPIGQFHLNYRWEHNSIKQDDEEKVGKLLVFGYSHKIGRSSSLLADFSHEKETLRASTYNELEIGWMKECFKEFYLGLGAGLEVQQGYFSSTLAIQKTF